MLESADEAAALERLHDLGCTDGLPVVIPTRQRVDRMVLAVGHPGEVALGTMGPLNGVCTVEKLAVAAVMAGCLPDHMPISPQPRWRSWTPSSTSLRCKARRMPRPR